MIALFLKHAGFDVSTANSAEDALHLTAQCHFDLIISDIGMPQMNGYELARRIFRDDPSLPPRIRELDIFELSPAFRRFDGWPIRGAREESVGLRLSVRPALADGSHRLERNRPGCSIALTRLMQARTLALQSINPSNPSANPDGTNLIKPF